MPAAIVKTSAKVFCLASLSIPMLLQDQLQCQLHASYHAAGLQIYKDISYTSKILIALAPGLNVI